MKYFVGFLTSSTGGLSAAANSRITITFPAGTNLAPLTNSSVRDTTTNTAVGSCGVPTGQVFSCGLSGGGSIPSGDSVQVELDGVTNPNATSSESASISTTSDRPSVNGNYAIRRQPPAS